MTEIFLWVKHSKYQQFKIINEILVVYKLHYLNINKFKEKRNISNDIEEFIMTSKRNNVTGRRSQTGDLFCSVESSASCLFVLQPVRQLVSFEAFSGCRTAVFLTNSK